MPVAAASLPMLRGPDEGGEGRVIAQTWVEVLETGAERRA